MDPFDGPLDGENIADLNRQDEVNRRRAAFQFEKPVSQGGQRPLKFRKVLRMREITGSEKIDPFLFSPERHRFHLHLPGRGPAVFGVNVKISDDFHSGIIGPSTTQTQTSCKCDLGIGQERHS